MSNVFERLYKSPTKASIGQRTSKYSNPDKDVTEWKRPTARPSSPTMLPVFKISTPIKRAKAPIVRPPPVKDIRVPPRGKCITVFDSIDMNGNGVLSLAELDKAVVEIWPDFNNKAAIMRAYKASDSDGNGFVSRKEFVSFLKFISFYNNWWRVFDSTDENDDRRISRAEFAAAAPKLGISNAEKVFDEMDMNKGGIVLFDEFCAYMAKQDSAPTKKSKSPLNVGIAQSKSAPRQKSPAKEQSPMNEVPNTGNLQPKEETKPSSSELEAPNEGTPRTKKEPAHESKSFEKKVPNGGASETSVQSREKSPEKKEATPMLQPLVPTAALNVEVPPKDECMALFDRTDYNGNGILSLAELDKAVVELWPEFDNKPAIMRAYKASDIDGNGFVKRNEFVFFLRYISYYNNLWSMFGAADADSDRRLTKEEFLAIAPQVHIVNPTDFFEEMDTNQGGVVLFDEFCARMAKQDGSNMSLEAEKSVDSAPVEVGDDPSGETPKNEVEVTKSYTSLESVADGAQNIEIPPKDECFKVFDTIDYNGNGILSLAEIDKAVAETWPDLDNKPAIMRAYKASDRDGDGFVKREEFEFFLKCIVYYNNFWKLFESTDEDDDRRLSKEEFIGASSKLNISNAEEVFHAMDTNGGGYVLFDEFCAHMAARD